MSTKFYIIDLEIESLRNKLETVLTPNELSRIVINNDEDRKSIRFIGKRSAAGPYCWNCNVTLNKGGEENVHKSGSFFGSCPKCHTTPTTGENVEQGNPIYVELGFSRPRQERPKGVHGCSSFRFHLLEKEVQTRLKKIGLGIGSVVDEYGRIMTGGDFLRMLEANCPIRYFSPDDNWS